MNINKTLNEEYDNLIRRLQSLHPHFQMRWNSFENAYGKMTKARKVKLLKTFLQVCEVEFSGKLYQNKFWEN
jgi:hypothetical protein